MKPDYTPKTAYTYGVQKPTKEQALQVVEKTMLDMPQVDCPVIHRFGPGVYIREVTIPADTFAIGHHQNFEHMNVMLKGRVTVLNDDGSTSELVAPMMFVGKPGRKIGYIHEDVVWLNVYATAETDVETLENTFITKSSTWLESQAAKNGLALLKSTVDADDFQNVLDEFGFTAEQAREQAENEADMIDLPFGGYKIKVDSSAIEGKGLFATAAIGPGELVAPARIGGKRTIAGRYTNHSVSPNAQMVMLDNGDISLVAIKQISGCRGGENGEEITINYREALRLQIKEV